MRWCASVVLLVTVGSPVSAAYFRASNSSVAEVLYTGKDANTTGDIVSNERPTKTFMWFYNGHTHGRGIWKWNNALQAYQRHFSFYANRHVAIAEVGVQSGGSVNMWQTVLGPKCHVYGIDINPNTQQFANSKTTITLGDQADVKMWNNFFANTVKTPLDILVDDGGHEPQQMLITLQESFPRMNPGGSVVIEDIHGTHYTDSFFTPAATFLAQQYTVGNLDSVHVYPFLLIAKRAGQPNGVQRSSLSFTGAPEYVSTFAAMWKAIPNHKGGHLILRNPKWGTFLTAQGMTNFFTHFQNLHIGNWYSFPKGCASTKAATCTNMVKNSGMQALITGIHIYANQLVVEVTPSPAVIQATRKGDQWIDYR